MKLSLRLISAILLSFMLLTSTVMGPVKVEARVCETRSQKFKGPCVSENNCANVCQTEGFPDGDCNGILRRCYCNSPC
ncbi:Defensin-like protein 1 [Cardamine amara subsp. amara]|uniref:Defensin-like protein 1 n=1 Tax=Cardamine amara subsp. amara TaxID=228776 RepID=A0ABD1BV60_CARAN